MRAAESIQSKEADVTEEELVIVGQRLKTFDADRKTTTPSQEVFRNIIPPPATESQR